MALRRGISFVTLNYKPQPIYAVIDSGGKRVATIHEVVKRNILGVPWVSQLGPTAAFAGGDCGPACVTMWLHYHKQIYLTVDDVSEQTQLPRGYIYTMPAHLMKALRFYGVSTYWRRNLTLDDLRTEVDAGEPCIILVEYDYLPARARYDMRYVYGHWMLIVGTDSDAFYIHDPYWPSTSGGAFVKLADVELLYAWGNNHESGNSDFQAIRRVRG